MCMLANKNNKAPYLSNSSEENPSLFNFNTAFVRYCDGGSYSGDSQVDFGGRTLQFRGRTIRDAVIRDLLLHHGMARATDVLISGCSAGGLAVLFGIDQIASMIHEVVPRARVRGMVDSGFFIEHSHGRTNYERKAVAYHEALDTDGRLDYAYAMKQVYQFMNLSAGIDTGCLSAAAQDAKGPEYCVFAERGKYSHKKISEIG